MFLQLFLDYFTSFLYKDIKKMNSDASEIMEKMNERIKANRQLKDSHLFQINGHQYIVDPLVFAPGLFKSDVINFMIENLSNACKTQPLPSLFQLGTGCGVILLEVAMKVGLKNIGGSDITEEAVVNARKNFDKFGFQGQLWTSDVFDAIKDEKKYDVIFWHYPFYPSDKKYQEMDPVERNLKDSNLRGIEKAFNDMRRYLNPNGRFLMSFSQKMGNWPLLQELLEKNKLKAKKLNQMQEQRQLCVFEVTPQE